MLFVVLQAYRLLVVVELAHAVQEAYLGQMAGVVSSSAMVLARYIPATANATGLASVVVVEPLLQWSVVLLSGL